MYKLCCFLIFVLLSYETFGAKIKLNWENVDGYPVYYGLPYYPDSFKPNHKLPPNRGTTKEISLEDCLRSCPVTSEYNPVCGSDNITYENPGRLKCAQSCGINIKQMGPSRCPDVA